MASRDDAATADLQSIAAIVAKWADETPAIATAYIFGSRARGDAHHDSDLDLAVDFAQPPSMAALADWARQNETNFADLKSRLGSIQPKFLYDRHDAAWPAIRKAAKHPVLTIGKVICCGTPRLKPHDEPR